MTVIVYKDGIMAADGVSVAGSLMYPVAFPKILKLPDGRLIGAAGYSSDCWAVFEWFRSGGAATPSFIGKDKDSEVDVLLANADGSLWRNGNGVTGFYPVESPGCIGLLSACTVADAAMRTGRTAEQAVELACQMCVGISGPIQIEKVGMSDG